VLRIFFNGNSLSKDFFKGNMESTGLKTYMCVSVRLLGYPTEMDVYLSYFTPPVYIVKYNGFPLTSPHTTCSCTRRGRVRPA
jgi:hypothetical protein